MIDPKLSTFIAVATIKNFTKAAEMLNLTQPAVTQHIKHLEDFYGVSLISKNGRKVDLTEEGKILYKYARQMELLSSLLDRDLRNSSGITRRYHIGATLTISEFVLPQILGTHKREFPNIDIIMQVSNTEVIMGKLLKGELDLALIEGPFDKSRFVHEKLKDDELVVAASPKNELALERGACMDDILKGKLILREEGSGTRKVFENYLLENGYSLKDLKPYMEVGSIGAIKSLVASNLGHTVISMEAVRAELEAGVLVSVPFGGAPILREFSFAYLKEGPQDFIKEFTSFVKQQAGIKP